MEEVVWRRAGVEDGELLNTMTVAGVRYWGHGERFPDLIAQFTTELPSPEETAAAPTWILSDGDDIVGFYSLRDRGDHVELVQMFLDTSYIGQGVGRQLWQHAVERAADMGDRMKIISDPGAVGFYERMGAELETTREVVPGFTLSVYWFDLG